MFRTLKKWLKSLIYHHVVVLRHGKWSARHGSGTRSSQSYHRTIEPTNFAGTSQQKFLEMLSLPLLWHHSNAPHFLTLFRRGTRTKRSAAHTQGNKQEL
jgi:hypothetical protein